MNAALCGFDVYICLEVCLLHSFHEGKSSARTERQYEIEFEPPDLVIESLVPGKEAIEFSRLSVPRPCTILPSEVVCRICAIVHAKSRANARMSTCIRS